MGRRQQERAALRALQRQVWGNGYYERHVVELARGRQRRFAVGAVAVGVQMLIAAVALFVFATVASAHTSQIQITCTKVQFNYANFPDATPAIAQESVVIDGTQGPQHTFDFTGPTATDVITISVTGSGSHSVHATTNWSFNGQPQGSAELTQEVSDCAPTTSTTTHHATTSTSTTTLPVTSTTRRASTTTSSMISGETTTVPITAQGSTTIPSTTTSVPAHTTTTTISPVTPRTLPFTGSSTKPISVALGMLGVGAIALGVSKGRDRRF